MIDITPILEAMKSDDAFALARAKALLTVYHARWQNKWSDYEIIDVESEFSFPLLSPETEAASRSFDEAGKIDVLTRHRPTKRLVVIEHKTTGDSVAPDSDYWDRITMSTQVSKYFLAAMQRGEEVGSVIYDVIKKPGQRPSNIPLLDENGFKIVLDAGLNRIFTKDGKKPRETGDAEKGWVVSVRPETPEEYFTRVLAVIEADPNSFFAQRETPRTDSQLLEYMNDTWATSQQLLYFRTRNLWPRNPDACDQFGKCEFIDLCCGRASVDSIHFRKRENIHAELKIQNSGTRELLTNSRCSTLRRCARLHELKYEQGIERVGEYSEALSFGTLVHQGLEAYFKSLKNKQ